MGLPEKRRSLASGRAIESGHRFTCATDVTSETSGGHTPLRKEADDRKKVILGSCNQTAEPRLTEMFSEKTKRSLGVRVLMRRDQTRKNKSIEEMIRRTTRCSYSFVQASMSERKLRDITPQ